MGRMRQEGDVASRRKSDERKHRNPEDLTLEFEFPKVQLASNCFLACRCTAWPERTCSLA